MPRDETMKSTTVFVIGLVAVILMRPGFNCHAPVDSEPQKATITAYVYFGSAGLTGKDVEIVELGVKKTTDTLGLAEFGVAPGTYTLRFYNINRGGPALMHIDSTVTVSREERLMIKMFDCLPCV